LSNFDPSAIARSGQCFRMWETMSGCVEVLAGNRCVSIEDLGDGKYAFSCTEEEYETFWQSYFDLDTDYDSFFQAIDPEDAYLLRAAAQGRGLRILRQDPWETLISFILSQRKSIPAIQDAIEKLCTCFGNPVKYQGRVFHAFPTPQALAQVPQEALSACSVGYRAPYIASVARLVASGEIELDALVSLSDDLLLEQLMRLYGVGVKVANCVLLFGYHRLAAAPVDVWIQRIIDSEYGGMSPFEKYQGFAGVMQQYMFYGKMLEKAEHAIPRKRAGNE